MDRGNITDADSDSTVDTIKSSELDSDKDLIDAISPRRTCYTKYGVRPDSSIQGGNQVANNESRNEESHDLNQESDNTNESPTTNTNEECHTKKLRSKIAKIKLKLKHDSVAGDNGQSGPSVGADKLKTGIENQSEAHTNDTDDVMNMFASVWVKVEVEEDDDNIVQDDVNDVNYEPPGAKRTRQRKKRDGEKKQRARPTKTLNCTVCDYTTVYKTCLVMHMIGHTSDKPHSCPMCGYKSKYRNSLTRHMKIQHQSEDTPLAECAKVFSCDECDYKTHFKWNLRAHKRKHNLVKQFKCQHCDYETAYRHNYLKHSRTHENSNKEPSFYKCDKCTFVTKFEGHIARHLAKIHNEVTDTAYKCDMCDFSTRVRWRLNIHKARSRQENVLVCAYCDFQTYFMCESKKHKVLHYDVMYGHKGQLSVSTECKPTDMNEHNSQIDATTGLPTYAKEDMNVHDDYLDYTQHQDTTKSQRKYMIDPNCIDWNNIQVLESDDKDRPFQCHMCSYTSRFKASVQRHFQRHHTGSQNRPYKCINCDFSTKTKDQIALHNKRSKSEVGLYCAVCKFTTNFKCQYVMHQKRHYENKCTECDYSCKHKYELQKHYMTIHMGNGHKCQYCNYIAARKESLLCHETIHTGIKPFKCNHCEYMSVRRSLLNNHVRRYHSHLLSDVVVVSDSKIESLKHVGSIDEVNKGLDLS